MSTLSMGRKFELHPEGRRPLPANRAFSQLHNDTAVRSFTLRTWTEPYAADFRFDKVRAADVRYKVVAYDYGIKHNIMRPLVVSGFDVTVVPLTGVVDAHGLIPRRLTGPSAGRFAAWTRRLNGCGAVIGPVSGSRKS